LVLFFWFGVKKFFSMTPYKSKSGKESGVEAFEIGIDYIIVKFKHEEESYLYSESSAGTKAIRQMKDCTAVGIGLSTYISRQKPKYAKKFVYKPGLAI
jgi:hypothetical protein